MKNTIFNLKKSGSNFGISKNPFVKKKKTIIAILYSSIVQLS